MQLLPKTRKRFVVLMSCALFGFFLLFIFQTCITYITLKNVISNLEERTFKLNLVSKETTLVSSILSHNSNKEENIRQLNQINALLSGLVRTNQGKNTVQEMSDAINNVSAGGQPDQLLEASREINEFQNAQLGNELSDLVIQIKQKGLTGLVSNVSLTILLSIFIIWGVHRLSREYLLTKLIMQEIRNGIIVGNRKGRISILNQAFCYLSGGCKGSNMLGRPLAEAGEIGRLLALAINENNFELGQEIFLPDDGNKQTCLLIDTVPWKDDRDKILGGMAVVRDNTAQWLEKQKMNAENNELKEKAEHDSMTGLHNYRAFIHYLQELVSEHKKSFALMMIDVDNFKIVNDTLGHLAGDGLLRELAGLMLNLVREDDMVARYGGDEFVIILNAVSLPKAIETGERLRSIIADYPFLGRECLPGGHLTTSIGIAGYPVNEVSVDGLIKCADAALYQAKRLSKNSVQVYSLIN